MKTKTYASRDPSILQERLDWLLSRHRELKKQPTSTSTLSNLYKIEKSIEEVKARLNNLSAKV